MLLLLESKSRYAADRIPLSWICKIKRRIDFSTKFQRSNPGHSSRHGPRESTWTRSEKICLPSKEEEKWRAQCRGRKEYRKLRQGWSGQGGALPKVRVRYGSTRIYCARMSSELCNEEWHQSSREIHYTGARRHVRSTHCDAVCLIIAHVDGLPLASRSTPSSNTFCALLLV